MAAHKRVWKLTAVAALAAAGILVTFKPVASQGHITNLGPISPDPRPAIRLRPQLPGRPVYPPLNNGDLQPGFIYNILPQGAQSGGGFGGGGQGGFGGGGFGGQGGFGGGGFGGQGGFGGGQGGFGGGIQGGGFGGGIQGGGFGGQGGFGGGFGGFAGFGGGGVYGGRSYNAGSYAAYAAQANAIRFGVLQGTYAQAGNPYSAIYSSGTGVYGGGFPGGNAYYPGLGMSGGFAGLGGGLGAFGTNYPGMGNFGYGSGMSGGMGSSLYGLGY